jgi:hypothetical protein
MSDIEGKAAQEAASECGQRASFNREANPLAETFVRVPKFLSETKPPEELSSLSELFN